MVNGAMLHLIKMWLEAPVEKTDECGNRHRSNGTEMNTGNPAIGTDRPDAQQSVHAPVRPWLEEAGTREATESLNHLAATRLPAHTVSFMLVIISISS